MRQTNSKNSFCDVNANIRRATGFNWSRSALLAAVVSTGAILMSSVAVATPIDEFTETTIVGHHVIAPSLANHSAFGLASVAGGDRHLELDVSAASSLANSVAFAIDTSGAGQADYASGPMADGDLSLLYDGATLAADLGGTIDSIEVNFLAFDDGFGLGMDVTVTISDGANTADLTIPLGSSQLNPFQLVFDIGSFSGGAVNASALTSIQFDFAAMQGQDFVLDSLHVTNVVPEPTTLALLGLGVAIALVPRRRRNH